MSTRLTFSLVAFAGFSLCSIARAAVVTATASSEEKGRGNLASMAVDGDVNTRWCAADGSMPQSLQLEFAKPQDLTGIEIVWESKNNAYQHTVEIDGKTLVTSTIENAHALDAKQARKLIITCTGTNQGGWASIREVKLKGPGIQALAPPSASNMSFSIYKDGGNIPPRIEKLTPEQEAAILKDVKVADGFEVSLFANSAAANYPVFVAAAPDGTLYVSSDGNGSLGRLPKRGRIIRLRDLDGDGRADETKVFCEVDSPRGLVWDHDRLYLVHPPHLSEFIDADHDGVAEKQNILVKDIAFGFKDRPADHTTNGLSLGIDGWLYIAGGDFGFLKATGTDGRTLQHRGGGVIRVRPDGTGLELYSTGTRNILEVAISPLMDIFARDNTNDGGGWDVRFHHFTGLDDHGYPLLFKNFPDECIQPLADYGGGSGCGAVYIDEPGFGEWNNAPFTCDWGTGALYHHKLKPKGATFEEVRKPEPFVKMTRPTDADVDGMSRLYVASWKGATFNWEGPDVGYIVQVKPKGWNLRSGPGLQAAKTSESSPANEGSNGLKPETTLWVDPLPDFAKASDAELVKVLESPSHRRRMEAQRELVRRGPNNKTFYALLKTARDTDSPLVTRAVAILGFSLRNPTIKEEHYGDFGPPPDDISIRPFIALSVTSSPEDFASADPRVRLAALKNFAADDGYYRFMQFKLAIQLLGDADVNVRHSAIRAIGNALEDLEKPPFWSGPFEYPFPNSEKLPWGEYLISFFDLSGQTPRTQGALLAFAQSHNSHITTGLISRLAKATDPALRQGILAALCRLHFKEGEWKGESWGTRPDTRGPYYQPEAWSETPKIAAALKDALAKAGPEEAAFLVSEMNRNRIQSDDALGRILVLARQDARLIPDVIAQLAAAETIPADAVPMLIAAARRSGPALQSVNTTAGQSAAPSTKGSFDGLKPVTTSPAAMLAQTITAITKTDSAEAWSAALEALVALDQAKGSGKEQEAGRGAFLNSPKLENVHQALEAEAAKVGTPTAPWAEAALLTLAMRKGGSPEAREMSQKALDAGWASAERRLQIINAVVKIKSHAMDDKILAAISDPDPRVANAARNAVNHLKLQLKGEDKTPKIGSLKIEDAISAVVKTQGDKSLGEQIFTRATCVACHTTTQDQPQKGPYLGNIAQTYKRPDLAQNILDPNKTIAQGFASEMITMKDGTQQMGFITLEGAAEVKLRNIAAQEFTFKTADIKERQKLPVSMMPPGLMLNFTVMEFASLLEYLESLARK